MIGLASEQPIATSGEPKRQIGAAIAGLCVGALTAVGLLVIVPHYPISPFSLLVRALVYSIAVFAASGATTLLCLGTTPFPSEVRSPLVRRTASTAIWLAPFAALVEQESGFALVLWIVFCVDLARLAAFLRKALGHDTNNQQSAGSMFVFPKPNWKPVWFSLAGAFLCEAAAVAVIGYHASTAVLLVFLGTIPLIWRGVWMIEALPAAPSPLSERQPLHVVIITAWLIIFGWLPYILQHGEGGSFKSLWSWKLFAANYASSQNTKKDPADQDKKSLSGAPTTRDTVFPGVILYPERKTLTMLVAPPARLSSGPGTEQSEPLSIPFDGVYWLWQSPRDHPPSTAVLEYGSPAMIGFHSADGSQLWMEAHQNLVKPIGLDCCYAIQVVIDNADSHPKAVAVELMLRNTGVAGKPFVSLGTQSVAGRNSQEVEVPIAQTLTFSIPDEMKRSKFDELKVGFRLDFWRGDKSAKIAINRFVLIPGR